MGFPLVNQIAIYDHYEILSLGIFIGPLLIIAGFFLRKKKPLSRFFMSIGIIYFMLSSVLVHQFIQGEKEIVKLRESHESK